MPKEIVEPIKQELARAAELVHFDTIKNVPVDEGDLAASVHKAKRSGGFVWWVGWWKKGNLRRWRQAGWRAHFAEFGTRGSNTLPAQRARPSLGPAYRKNEKFIVRRIKAAVNKALKKVSKL